MSIKRDLAVARACELLRKFEGLRLQAYQDVAGVWTVGYGATGPEISRLTVWDSTKAEADLVRRVTKLYAAIEYLDLTYGQAAAVISLVYNIGLGAFDRSTLLKYIHADDYLAAADEFLKWTRATVGGKKVLVPGLVTRRAAERDCFLANTNRKVTT